MARSADPMSYATGVSLSYFVGIPNGVLRPDDSAVREIEDLLRTGGETMEPATAHCFWIPN